MSNKTRKELKSKDELYEELKLTLQLPIKGIHFEPDTFKEVIEKHPELQLLHLCMDPSKDSTVGYYIPASYYTESGFQVYSGLNRRGVYHIEKEQGAYYIADKNSKLLRLYFMEAPKFYSQITSDGVAMKTIASDQGNRAHGHKIITIAYSNECALRDKGFDCLFCNINATKNRYGEQDGVQWKTPLQIGETVKAAYAEGYEHVTITGGFIPERREVDYYLDVAESIRDHLGRDDFNGTACIGAPRDLSTIEKYKEAGFSSIAFNMEVWNKDFFQAICPGKAKECGGYDHWRESLTYAVEVFGKGNVRSNFVAGLEPKDYLLEGIETLSSQGIVATATPWGPNLGSKLEGHQSPTFDWHWEVQNRITSILRKNGITYKQLSNTSAGNFIIHEIYRIEEGLINLDSAEFLE